MIRKIKAYYPSYDKHSVYKTKIYFLGICIYASIQRNEEFE